MRKIIKDNIIVSSIAIIIIIVFVIMCIGIFLPEIYTIRGNITEHGIIKQIESAEQTMKDDNIKPIPKEDMTKEELAKKSSERLAVKPFQSFLFQFPSTNN